MTRHRVLHILGTAQPEGAGIARIVAALARGLDPERYRVDAWFLGGDGPLVGALETAGAQASALEWHRGARDPVGAWRFWRRLLGRGFAIVHMHAGGRSVRWLARAATRARIVVHLHGRILEPRGLGLVTHSGRGADAVIAVSRAVAERVAGARPLVVYPGIRVPATDGPPAPLGGTTAGRIIGSMGRLLPLKGLVYLLRAIASLRVEFPNLAVEIAGLGPERATLEGEAQKLGLADGVRFLGWVEELAPVLARWELFVLPSLEEGFPMAVLDAMAAGLPVVASAVGGISELVENGRTGWLVPPADPRALADRLRMLLLDPEQERAMGAAGRARICEHFSAERMVAQLAEIYDGLLGSREGAPPRS
jgi:glycosyltransferase involved in cell wall biosynthesis